MNNKKKIAMGLVAFAIAGAWGAYYLSTRDAAGKAAAEEATPAGIVDPEASRELHAAPAPQRADPFEIPPTDALGSYKRPSGEQIATSSKQ